MRFFNLRAGRGVKRPTRREIARARRSWRESLPELIDLSDADCEACCERARLLLAAYRSEELAREVAAEDQEELLEVRLERVNAIAQDFLVHARSLNRSQNGGDSS
jgi:hypothetical protein